MKPYFYIFVELFLYLDSCNYSSSIHLQEDFPNVSAEVQKSMQRPNNSVLILSRGQFWCIGGFHLPTSVSAIIAQL